jgi:hypothetical protein
VQAASPQGIPDDATVISFVVPAADLVAAFGIGEFEMRIFAEPGGLPIAVGTFELRERPTASAAPSP